MNVKIIYYASQARTRMNRKYSKLGPVPARKAGSLVKEAGADHKWRDHQVVPAG